MKKLEKKYDCGVVVARFQVDNLHSAHIDLIQSVCNEHDKVIVFLGLSPVMVTQNNPLDFESRKQMILEKFKDIIVLYIKDNPSDIAWSKDLDEKIDDVVSPGQSVVLYGSRDSFISHYNGKYNTQELIQETYISGSEIRKSLSKKVKNTPEFRAGVIWAAYNQYPACYPTVDAAIFNEDETKILLAKKKTDILYRFVGGFADPKSNSYEEDLKREVEEETSLEVGDITYIGSSLIDDWRYRNEVDKIKTLLFKCKVIFGRPTPQDDLSDGELRWFDINQLIEDQVMPAHRVLLNMLKTI